MKKEKEIENWCLLKHKDSIKVLSWEYPDYLDELCRNQGIRINENTEKNRFYLDWVYYDGAYSFFYDYINNEEEIKNWLLNSSLKEAEFIIMDYGYNGPIVQIPVPLFIDHWYDFVRSAYFETVVIAQGSNLFLEFVRDGYLLKSNFRVKPEER
ncbi:MAG: hypothetical protein H6581_25525 [Bacteroidia bacterium]|nr:hypothetical protein [Bacteroidia bacterium]